MKLYQIKFCWSTQRNAKKPFQFNTCIQADAGVSTHPNNSISAATPRSWASQEPSGVSPYPVHRMQTFHNVVPKRRSTSKAKLAIQKDTLGKVKNAVGWRFLWHTFSNLNKGRKSHWPWMVFNVFIVEFRGGGFWTEHWSSKFHLKEKWRQMEGMDMKLPKWLSNREFCWN